MLTDVREETLVRLTAIRQAIAQGVLEVGSLGAVRAALREMFESFTLYT